MSVIKKDFAVIKSVKEVCVLFHIPISNAWTNLPTHKRLCQYFFETRRRRFNVAHFKARTTSTLLLLRERMFADNRNSAKNASSDASKKFSLKMNKTIEVLYQLNSSSTNEARISFRCCQNNKTLVFSFNEPFFWTIYLGQRKMHIPPWDLYFFQRGFDMFYNRSGSTK